MMARLIGGPLHETIMDVKADRLIIPIYPNSRTPKAQAGYLNQGIYQKTRYVVDGEIKTVYRFVYGYYEPMKGCRESEQR